MLIQLKPNPQFSLFQTLLNTAKNKRPIISGTWAGYIRELIERTVEDNVLWKIWRQLRYRKRAMYQSRNLCPNEWYKTPGDLAFRKSL